MSQSITPLLSVENLKMHFIQSKGIFSRKKVLVTKAVDDVSFQVESGKTLGLVGESGCGKSSLGRTLVRLYTPQSGRILLNGADITKLEGAALKNARRNFQMIFQDPYSSLNPRMNVFDILREPLTTHGIAKTKNELSDHISKLMEMVGLSKRFAYKYPHEFSGGQRQRVAIARSLAIKPKLVICDEPVSALDVSIQAQILNLLSALQKEFGLTYIFIAHDLAAVRHISNQIAVMYLGKIVEKGRGSTVINSPKHPYTQALLSAVPIPDPELEQKRTRILLKSDIASTSVGQGCPFYGRCHKRMEICQITPPPLQKSGEGHEFLCHIA